MLDQPRFQKPANWIHCPRYSCRNLWTLLPFLIVVCNHALHKGVLPASQKRSILVPVPKCEGLDTADPNNFRPIGNVNFLSNAIEKVVATQLTAYLFDVSTAFDIVDNGTILGWFCFCLQDRYLYMVHGSTRSRVPAPFGLRSVIGPLSCFLSLSVLSVFLSLYVSFCLCLSFSVFLSASLGFCLWLSF